ncbi:helix-turn-helix domain-containing protein [Variovorax sp.]|uniref:helix-turn-helix domain-containing protein n=1 Tax=Variovorax sp. TaxID=1871043 RepID=UPI003BA97D66
MESIGSRIKAARTELRWSQLRLADEAGVTQSAIGNLEAGWRQRPKELLAIAQALGVQPGWLETGQGVRSLGEVRDSRPVRTLIEQLATIAAPLRPVLRRNFANLLVEVIEHPDDAPLLEQASIDIESILDRYGAPGSRARS